MNKSQLYWIFALILIILGLGLRLVDVTDPPADFHATRQFRGAIIARDIYYQLLPDADPQRQALAGEMRVHFPEFEPPLLETTVAFGYLILGKEALWIARVIVSLIWCLGGLILFDLVKRSVAANAGLVALVYYLFLPFGVIASRSFQPDPVMTAGLLLMIYFAYRWSETPTWKWALLTGSLGAVVVLLKVVAAYLIIGLMVAVVFKTSGFRKTLKNAQVWSMAALMAVPPGYYYLFSISDSSSNYVQNWIVALMPFTLTAEFYIGWLKRLYGFNPIWLLVAALGTLLFAKGRSRWMLWGLWIGYAFYGFSLPYQTATHNYYHLQLVPIIAWSLAFSVQWVLDRIQLREKWQYTVLAGFVIFGVAFSAFEVFGIYNQRDSRDEPEYWASVGEQIPADGETIGVVQYYGHLLMYYGWRDVDLWPDTAEMNLSELRGNSSAVTFSEAFADRTAGKQYFLITHFGELEKQPELSDYLTENYPVFAEGPGYLIYDLRKSISE
jgi:hypothetical protein